jgi:hypothetical protein
LTVLSEQDRQLLTAYVDGELSARQQQSASRLLEHSAEAQEFIRQLQADAATLRSLPRRQLGPEFSEKVLATIDERWMFGPHRPRLARGSVYSGWIGLAAAAAVLFVVGTGVTLYFYSLPQHQQKIAVAKNDPIRPAKSSDAGAVAKEKTISPVPTKEKQSQPESSGFPEVAENDDKPMPAANPPILEFTAAADVAIETEPTRRLEVFKELEQAGFALRLTLRDLDQPRLQERLRETLKDDKAFHLDLACPSTAKGLDRIQAVFQAKGVKLLIDKAALTRWKKGLKTHYALYSEDLTPEELTVILQALGADDRKANPEQRFNKIVINHLGSANRSEICTLLGVDPHTMAAKPKGPLGVDITQPLSKKTEEQLADFLSGKGTPRPEPGKAVAPKGPERLALILSYNPVRVSPASSKEVKQFLATRPGQRPGAVQILLVLRGS